MKKLLLITSLLVGTLFLASCQSNSKTITKSDTKANPSTGAISADTTKQNTHTTTAGTTNTISGTKKDSTTTPTKTNAINHSSPNQAQLDSIKAIKTKDKNKKDQ
ncbi:MAG: hypothetical protein IPL10_02010 [Bacteroidetes bacterium]|nr:hypothetical protein [Bacteroidota bacterium]